MKVVLVYRLFRMAFSNIRLSNGGADVTDGAECAGIDATAGAGRGFFAIDANESASPPLVRVVRSRVEGRMNLQSNLLALACLGVATVAAAQSDVSKGSVPGVVNFGYIGKTVACAGATAPSALAEVKKLGYASVINLRVASEPGADIDASAAAAQAAGLRFIHLPFNASAPDPMLVDTFIAAITDAKNQPAFIHCASANRAATLWMVKRMVIDKWDADRAAAEATALGMTSPALKAFAIEQAQARLKR